MATFKIEEGGLSYRYLKSRAKLQVFGGGFGNGKTASLSVKFVQIAGDYPGANLLLSRSTYPKLNDTLRKEFYKWMPKALVRRWPTKDDNTMYLYNGTSINFRYVAQRGKTSEDGQTTSNLLSATYDAIGLDQVEDPEIVEKDLLDLFGRLRGTTPYRGNDLSMPPTGPRWLCLTCNPTGNWFYRKIIKPLHIYQSKGLVTKELMVGKDGKPIIELYEGSTYENKENLPADFIETQEAAYKGQMRDRYLLGKWGAFEGLVYSGFDSAVHMIDRETVMRELDFLVNTKKVRVKAIEGYDYGMVSPSCYLLGFIDDYGRVFVIDGFYEKEIRIDEQAGRIKTLRRKYGNLLEFKDSICADPDLFKRKAMANYKVLGTTIASIFNDEHGIKLRPSDNSITAGTTKVASYLNQYKHLPMIVPPLSSPLIMFVDDMEFIQSEFGNYFWKTNPQGEREDRPIDRNDHAMDAIKYMVSFRPKPGEIQIPLSQQTPKYMFWHEVGDQKHETRRTF